jgi:hypothetical protein
MTQDNKICNKAISLALDKQWDDAHALVQEISSPIAQWIHAVLHKIEGDEGNSRYWYARSSLEVYESYLDPMQELKVIKEQLKQLLTFPK